MLPESSKLLLDIQQALLDIFHFTKGKDCEPIPKPDGVALRIIFVCRKEQAKRLYPLRYCPERRDAAAGERRRNPLGQSLGGSSGGVASSVTMRRGIAPSSRLANRPAKTLRHLARLWDRF